MNKTVNQIIFLFIIFISHEVTSQIKGSVFWDENGNGLKDKREKGIEGAIVSNGLEVVKTDKNGVFTLPIWEKARFITIYPGASQAVKTRYIKVDKSIKTYNFAIQKKEIKKEVSFIQVSDTETFEYKDWLNNLKSYSNSIDPDFIIHTGDICYESGMTWHADNMTTKTMNAPVYYCIGNHDLVKGNYGEEYFENKFGPGWYAFEEGKALFVITPMMGGDFKPGYTREEIGNWLQNLLDSYPKEMPKYFFNHDYLTNGDEFVFKINDNKEILLNNYNIKAWIYGHRHANITKLHGITNIKSYSTATAAKGGIDHSPSSFRVIKIDDAGSSSSDLVWTFVNDQLQIVSPHHDELHQHGKEHVHLSSNVYSSNSPIDSVKYKVYDEKGLTWKTYVKGSEMHHMTQRSDWNWEATFKPEIPNNNYELAIEAYLKNGKVLYDKQKFTIKPGGNKAFDNKWHNLAGNSAHDAVVNFNHTKDYVLEWVKNIGSNIYMSSPILHENHVFTASFDDGNAEKNYIVCFDTQSGQEVWRYQTRNGIKNQMVIARDILIATDMQGYTYALNTTSGHLVWEKDLKYNRLPGFISGLVTDGTMVFTGFGETLSAIEVETGKTTWINSDWTGGYGSTTTMTLTPEILITSANWGALYAHDKNTGELLWKRNDNGLRFRDGNILFKEDKLWIAENDGAKGTLHVLEPKTGESIKTIETHIENKSTTTPIVTPHSIYIAGSDPGIASYERTTGKLKWLFEVEPALFYTPQYYSDHQRSIETTPVLVGDQLLFGAMDGWLYKLDAITGKLIWKTNLGAPILTSAAVTKEGFFICDFAGNIYFFKNK